jgi:hypothetical protein
MIPIKSLWAALSESNTGAVLRFDKLLPQEPKYRRNRAETYDVPVAIELPPARDYRMTISDSTEDTPDDLVVIGQWASPTCHRYSVGRHRSISDRRSKSLCRSQRNRSVSLEQSRIETGEFDLGTGSVHNDATPEKVRSTR